MTNLPSSFSSNPDRDLNNYFYNICHNFIKIIKKDPANIDSLQEQMQSLINASKQMTWKDKKSATYHKSEGQKAMDKTYNEFTRYIQDLQNNKNPSSNDLIEALNKVIQMIENQKVF